MAKYERHVRLFHEVDTNTALPIDDDVQQILFVDDSGTPLGLTKDRLTESTYSTTLILTSDDVDQTLTGSKGILNLLGGSALQTTQDFRINSDTTGIVLGSGQDVRLSYNGTNTLFSNLVGSGSFNFDTRINLASVAGSSTAGDLWQDSTQNALQTFASGVEQTLPGSLYTSTATATVSNTTDETTLIGSGVGTLTLPANFFVVGKTLRIRAWTYFSSDASPPTITIRAKLGSTTLFTVSSTASANASNWARTYDILWTCRSTGATGSVISHGMNVINTDGGSNEAILFDANTSATTIDTTAQQIIDFTAQWSVAEATASISASLFTVEILQ